MSQAVRLMFASLIVTAVALAGATALAQDPPASIAAPASSAEPPRPAVPVPADDRAEVARLMTRAAEAYAAEDHAAWVAAVQRLHELRPYNADFMRQLVEGYARTDRLSQAFNIMLKMQQQGLTEDWDAVEGLDAMRQYPLFEHLTTLMDEAGRPFGEARVEQELPGRIAMPEALAFDESTGRLFVGTVHRGEILVRGGENESADAALETFASPQTVPELMAVFDLVADAERGHLWVATGSTSQFAGATPTNFGRTSLIKLDLASGEKLGEYRVPPDGRPHLLGALALADDGTVYAADTVTPFIYRLEPDMERPELFIGNPMFTSLRGLALSQDESMLYVADYERGLFVFETAESRRGLPLTGPDTLNLGGIDGLYRWQDSLVVIQNGISPDRVLRLDLDESGGRIENVAPLVVAHPRFDTPTFGALAGDDLLLLASNHWDDVRPDGRPIAGPLPANAVLRSPVDEAQTLVVGREMLERMKQQGRPMQLGPDSGSETDGDGEG
ncbi:hypothetical protein [Halomonas denitrificans]|nr:hypothetical protein [Halomonas denitrificans]